MHGLSTGDRACLALALDERIPALTADRAWSKIDVGVEIRTLR
jgi:PIN domain nuclease of toxin-antitoxin system